MHIGELPMIIFTTVAQMSVGAFWILGLFQILGQKRQLVQSSVDRVTNAGMYAAGPLLIFGFLAASFHLNDPLHAPFTLLHLGSSWLSRELISGVLYAGFGAIFAISMWFRLFSRRVRDIFAALTALAGLLLIISMVGVYWSLPTVPAWNTWFTWISFFGTTFLLGSLAVALALSVTWRMHEGDAAANTKAKGWRAALRRGLLAEGKLEAELNPFTATAIRLCTAIAIITALIVLLCYPFHIMQLALSHGAGNEVAHAMMTHGYLAIRLILLAAVVVVLALAVRKRSELTEKPSAKLTWIVTFSFALALISELLGRGLHYEGLIRSGINTLVNQ
ncbi:MAG: dimethyl sulfoxide reductase anchor subunit [Actinomycetaceae bacterium]|nr:dimethyl sulfoxide reductase anchor subunit [Actinomycetaceae bacterium]